MISAHITRPMLDSILAIEQCRTSFPHQQLPVPVANKLRKLSKRRSAYSSNRIEGNPLTENQAEAAIQEKNRHFLKPEEEIRNYYTALCLLEKKAENAEPISINLILEIQRIIVAGESNEKIGIRGPMPPGVLFAVYDSETGTIDYIPPEASDIASLLEELINYLENSDDHPLIKAAILHYQLVTIHPFEDGNGRTARIISDYYLKISGYGFGGIGSLDEYFAYDTDEYYHALQMDLPVLFYDGRENPPHPEIWMEYFLHMVELYAEKAMQTAVSSVDDWDHARITHLGRREKELLGYLREHATEEFRPIDVARVFDVSNRTVINWCAKLAQQGFLEPIIVKQRVRSYRVL